MSLTLLQALLGLVAKRNQDGGNYYIIANRSFGKIIEELNEMESPFAIIVVGPKCGYTKDVFDRLILKVKAARITTSGRRAWRSEIREYLRTGQSVAIKLTDKESCNHAMRHAVICELKRFGAARTVVFFVDPPLKDVFMESVRELKLSRLLYALRIKLNRPTADGVDYLMIV